MSKSTFAALGDTHLGSTYEYLDALNAFYDEVKELKIKTVFHTGNYLEGEAPFNKTEIKVAGFEPQVNYFIENYPQRAGITTYFIDALEHEGWFAKREGIEVGKRVEQSAREAGRTDLVYLGSLEADVTLPVGDQTITVRLLHPGGGSATSVSLAAQKIVDHYATTELPDILLIGHYHKLDYLPNYRGVYAVQTGTFQQQSSFMRLQSLRAAVGGWVISVRFTKDGRKRVSAEHLSYPPEPWQHRRNYKLGKV